MINHERCLGLLAEPLSGQSVFTGYLQRQATWLDRAGLTDSLRRVAADPEHRVPVGDYFRLPELSFLPGRRV